LAEKKMKKTTKGSAIAVGRSRLPVAALAVAALAIVAGGLYAALKPRSLAVSLASLSSSEESSYRALLKEVPGVSSVQALAPGAALKPGDLPDALVCRMGAGLSGLSASLMTIPEASIDKVPPSLRGTVADAKGRVIALPLQLDQFQVAWSYAGFAKAGVKVKGRLSLAQLSAALAAYKNPAAPALLFAGGEDETLLLVVSALCESRGGLRAYRALVDAIRAKGGFEAISAAALGFDPGGGTFSLASLLDEMRAWRSKGYLHTEWYNLKGEDLLAYMRHGLGYVMLGGLSFRRSVPYEVIDGFGWDAYPDRGALRDRAFVAPMTVLALGAKAGGKRAEKARASILEALTSPDGALRLAKGTGRATAMSAAQAPDIQAADALAWAAGSGAVVNGIYLDAFASGVAAREFADKVREYVRR
jgi:hypothetical protein